MNVEENVKNTQKGTSETLAVKQQPKLKIDDLTQSSMGSINTNSLTDFDLFMNKMLVPLGTKDFTHQNFIGSGSGSTIYRINDTDYTTFLQLYTEHMKGSNFGTLNIMEKPKDVGCLCLDFDLKQKSNERLFTPDHFTKILKLLKDIITTTYKPKTDVVEKDDEDSDDDENDFGEILHAYVLVKNEIFHDEAKGQYVDGFHIQFPNLILTYVDRFYIFDRMKKLIEQQRIFDDIKDDLIDATKICDDSVISKNAWFLYGSGKTLLNKVHFYRLADIYDDDVETIQVDKTNGTRQILINKLAVRKTEHKNVTYVDKTAMLPRLEEIKRQYCQNRTTSVNVAQSFFKDVTPIGRTMIKTLDKPTKKKMDLNDDDDDGIDDADINDKEYLQFKKQEAKLVEKNVFNNDGYKPREETDIDMAKKFAKILSPTRAVPYHEWIYVGWALYGISPTLYSSFVEFSKQCPRKFSNEACQKVWTEAKNSGNKRRFGISSLRAWAFEDNPDMFLAIINAQVEDYIENCECKTDCDVANLLFIRYGDFYKCSSLKNHSWWEFQETRWVPIERGFTLIKKMGSEVCGELIKLYNVYNTRGQVARGIEADVLGKKATAVLKIIGQLKQHAFKQRVIAECEYLFYHGEFEKLLDNNHYLLGFNNGVFDLKAKCFRKSVPEDFVSASVGYDYEELSESDENVVAVEQFMKDIQPDEKMRTYLNVFLGSIVECGNRDQRIFIASGSGSNGKSILTLMLEYAFNGSTGGAAGYYGSVPPTFLTKEPDSASACTPALADKKICRILTTEEPGNNQRVQSSILKILSGGASILSRALYSMPIYFVPHFKIIMSCNDKPLLDGDDTGVRRRIIVIDFPIKFVKKPTLPNEKLIDNTLKDKVPIWRLAFVWLLLRKYYPMYVENGLDFYEPEGVRLSTMLYIENSSTFMEFFNSGEVIKDEKAKIPVTHVYTAYKIWHEQLYGDRKVPMLKTFLINCGKNNIKVDENKYVHGYKMKMMTATAKSEFDA